MKYLLSIFVPSTFINEAAGEKFVDRLGNFTYSPDKILLVDHSSSSVANGERRITLKNLAEAVDKAAEKDKTKKEKEFNDFINAQEKTKNGHLRPKFPPLAALHQIADEVRCSNDCFLGKRSEWEKSLQFKKYSILKAAEYGCDAVLLCEFPSLLSSNAAEAMITFLQENPQCSFTYPPVIQGTKTGENSENGKIKIMKKPGVANEFIPENKITEHGYMLRISSMNLKNIEEIKKSEEPQMILHELLKSGNGQGLAIYKGECIFYTHIKKSHIGLEKNIPRKIYGELIEIEKEKSDIDLIKYRNSKEHKIK